MAVQPPFGPLRLSPGPHGENLRRAGIRDFDDLWDISRNFVEPPNQRRGGWGGVVKLNLPGVDTVYYVKRQENQLRYSPRYLWGRLTYEFEMDSLLVWEARGYPVVDWAAYGFRRQGKTRQGLIVTACPPDGYLQLSRLRRGSSDLPVSAFRETGLCLFRLHREGWQHGALYPEHMFMDVATGNLKLIDLERSRKQVFAAKAAYNDLEQLVKRIDWLAPDCREALLAPYYQYMPDVMARLGIPAPTAP